MKYKGPEAGKNLAWKRTVTRRESARKGGWARLDVWACKVLDLLGGKMGRCCRRRRVCPDSHWS